MLDPGEVAWVAALPCALLVVASIVLLGPPLGHAFLEPGSERFWNGVHVHPEPAEHARYLIAVLGAPLLAAVALAGVRRPMRLSAARTRLLIGASEAVAFAFVVASLLALHGVLLPSDVPQLHPVALFPWSALAVAGAFALAFATGAPVRLPTSWIAFLTRETRRRRIAGVAVAAALTATWLSTAVNTDATIGSALANNLIPWDASETFAVLDGRTPLVDFHAQYAQLWPFLAAAVMALLGSATIGAWTTLMAAISGLALLAIYGVFRRVVHSSALALALFAPSLATGLFVFSGTMANRLSAASIFSLWPLRYAGPFLLAWLTARHIDAARPRRAWTLLGAAGLVVLNNAEFGIGAFLATLAALACHRLPHARHAGWRLLANAVVGLLAATLLVALLTLVRAGRLPDFALALEFPRLYGIGGWVLEPMPTTGLHLAMYLTFAAAIVLAAVRAARREEPVLTSMLAWSGVFGLVAGGYYAGRSDYLNLVALFVPWCFALVLLLVAVVRGLAARGWPRPSLPEIAVLFGFGLMLCSLPQVPTPWSQIARLERPAATHVWEQRAATAFVAHATRRGSRVAILIELGHRIAYDLGLANVAPYSGIEALPTTRQLQTTIAAIRREHVHLLFIPTRETLEEQVAVLEQAGFTLVVQQPGFAELTDAPRAAR